MEFDISTVLHVVERRTIAFFREELGMTVDHIDRCLHGRKQISLRAMTAIVSVGSKSGLYIAFSYDDTLIQAMTQRYTAGLSIGPDEEGLYFRETASDVVNVIIGNSTVDLGQSSLLTLSPPILMVGAHTICGDRGSTFAVLTLRLADGALDVAFVGPSVLFDDQLSYVR